MRSCLGLMLDMGKNPSQLLKSANWWTNECHQQERHDWCAMCHVSYQYCSSAPFYISPFTPFSCPPPPHQPWSRMSALILFWPISCSITGKYRIAELSVWFLNDFISESQKLAPKIWPFSLDIFPSKTTSGSTGGFDSQSTFPLAHQVRQSPASSSEWPGTLGRTKENLWFTTTGIDRQANDTVHINIVITHCREKRYWKIPPHPNPKIERFAEAGILSRGAKSLLRQISSS